MSDNEEEELLEVKLDEQHVLELVKQIKLPEIEASTAEQASALIVCGVLYGAKHGYGRDLVEFALAYGIRCLAEQRTAEILKDQLGPFKVVDEETGKTVLDCGGEEDDGA